jgi:uncharacterized membrane protein YhhN
MTVGGWIWVAVAAVLAALDWAAVAAGSQRLERCAKPAVLLALIAAAVTAQPRHSGVHGWLVLALCLGLIGDVALAFAPPGHPAGSRVSAAPADPDTGGPQPPSPLFTAGLASFLLGHLCYCAAMLNYGTEQLALGLGLLLVLLTLLAFSRPILAGARAQGGNPLMIAVVAYVAALGSTVVLGVGTTSLSVAAGIVLFLISDLVLASDRFVVGRGWAPLTVAVSYHVAQALLLLGLVH